MSQNYINGDWEKGSGIPFRSFNPATRVKIWEGHSSTERDVGEAIKSAQFAFETWADLSLEVRVSYLQKFVDLVSDKKEEIAKVISIETGKALWDARGEPAAMIGKLGLSINAYNDRTGTSQSINGTIVAKINHKPLGVMVVFGPFNFPAHLPNGHIIPALLAGNTVVFKPSEQTPMTAEFIFKLWHEAGLPRGVINLVQGAGETGKALISHKNINGVLFTGSVGGGRILAQQLSDRLGVMLALELGGNNPLIYWGAEDIKASAFMTIQSAYVSGGQRCTCARRLIVPNGDDGDKFIKTLIDTILKIKIGMPDRDPQPFIGSLISAQAAKDILRTQANLVQKGGRVLVEAKASDLGDAFLTPGLIDVTPIKSLEDDECFGPLLKVIRVKTIEDALGEANNTRFGLAAGIITDDKGVYEYFYQKSRAGIVNWNQPLTGASGAAPFGGPGESGNLRPSAYYAADYCVFPVASLEHVEKKVQSGALPPGLE